MWSVSQLTGQLGQTAKSFANNILFEDKDEDNDSDNSEGNNRAINEIQAEATTASNDGFEHPPTSSMQPLSPGLDSTPQKPAPPRHLPQHPQPTQAVNQYHHHQQPPAPPQQLVKAPNSMGAPPSYGTGLGYGMFSSTASSLIRSVGSVAAHVAGNDDAGAASRVQSQLDKLKSQVIEGAKENDTLTAEVHKLEHELRQLRENADMLSAGADTTKLLRQEFQHEQEAHAQTRSQLQQATDELESSTAARDEFWKHEMERERDAAASLRGQIQQLEAQINSSSNLVPPSSKEDPLSLLRTSELEVQLRAALEQVEMLSAEVDRMREAETAAGSVPGVHRSPQHSASLYAKLSSEAEQQQELLRQQVSEAEGREAALNVQVAALADQLKAAAVEVDIARKMGVANSVGALTMGGSEGSDALRNQLRALEAEMADLQSAHDAAVAGESELAIESEILTQKLLDLTQKLANVEAELSTASNASAGGLDLGVVTADDQRLVCEKVEHLETELSELRAAQATGAADMVTSAQHKAVCDQLAAKGSELADARAAQEAAVSAAAVSVGAEEYRLVCDKLAQVEVELSDLRVALEAAASSAAGLVGAEEYRLVCDKLAVVEVELADARAAQDSTASAAAGLVGAEEHRMLCDKLVQLEAELSDLRVAQEAAASSAAGSVGAEEYHLVCDKLAQVEAELSDLRMEHESVCSRAEALSAEMHELQAAALVTAAALAAGRDGDASQGGADVEARIESLEKEVAEERKYSARLAEEVDSMKALDESGVREQLSMMKELYEEEHQFSVQCKEQLEAEKALNAELKVAANSSDVGASSAASAELQSLLDQALADLSHKSSLLEDLTAQLQVAESRLAAVQLNADESAAAAAAQLAESAETTSQLQQQVSEAEASIASLRQAVNDAQAELEAEQSAHQETMAMLEVKLQALKGRNDRLAHEEEEEKQQVDDLERLLQEERAARAATEGSLLTLHASLTKAEGEVARSMSLQQELRSQLNSAAQQLVSAEAGNEHEVDSARASTTHQLQAAVQDAEDKLSIATADVIRLTGSLEASTAELAELAKSKGRDAALLAERQQQLEQAEVRCGTLSAQHALLAERQQLLDQVESQQGDSQPAEASQLSQRLAASTAELSEARSRYKALVSEHDAQLASLSAQYDEVVTALYDERKQREVEEQEWLEREAAAQAQLATAQAHHASESNGAAELQKEMESVLKQKEEEISRNTAYLAERDEFWKRELSSKAVGQTEVEVRYRQTLDQLEREQSNYNILLLDLDRLKLELSQSKADLTAQADSFMALKKELEATQLDLERAHSQAASYEHEHELENEMAVVKKEYTRVVSDNKKLIAQMEQLSQGTSEAAALQVSLLQLRSELADTQETLQLANEERQGLWLKLHDAESRVERQVQQEVFPGVACATAARATPALAGSGPADVSQVEDGATVAPSNPLLEQRITELEESLAAGDDERERLKSQLQRLKMQMMTEQEDEEEKVGWRVEAELTQAAETHAKEMAQLLAAQEGERAALRAEVERLTDELAKAVAASSRMLSESDNWEEILADKDREVANLQAALGELTYESEAAEKLRYEVRATAARLHEVHQELAASKQTLEVERSARDASDKKALEAAGVVEMRRQEQLRTSEECSMLRKALDQAMAQVQAMRGDNNSMVDRRIIVKLLLTYFEKGSSKDVLSLMARMLNMTEEEKGKVGLLGGQRRGFLRSAAYMPFSLVQGASRALTTRPAAPAVKEGAASLADQWVNFLLSQSELDNEATYALAAATHDVSHSASFHEASRSFTASREADQAPATTVTPSSTSYTAMGSADRQPATADAYSYSSTRSEPPPPANVPSFLAGQPHPPPPQRLSQSSFLTGQQSPNQYSSLSGQQAPSQSSSLSTQQAPNQSSSLSGQQLPNQSSFLSSQQAPNQSSFLSGQQPPNQSSSLTGQQMPSQSSSLSGQQAQNQYSFLSGQQAPSQSTSLSGQHAPTPSVSRPPVYPYGNSTPSAPHASTTTTSAPHAVEPPLPPPPSFNSSIPFSQPYIHAQPSEPAQSAPQPSLPPPPPPTYGNSSSQPYHQPLPSYMTAPRPDSAPFGSPTPGPPTRGDPMRQSLPTFQLDGPPSTPGPIAYPNHYTGTP